jgi:hypothetical protein
MRRQLHQQQRRRTHHPQHLHHHQQQRRRTHHPQHLHHLQRQPRQHLHQPQCATVLQIRRPAPLCRAPLSRWIVPPSATRAGPPLLHPHLHQRPRPTLRIALPSPVQTFAKAVRSSVAVAPVDELVTLAWQRRRLTVLPKHTAVATIVNVALCALNGPTRLPCGRTTTTRKGHSLLILPTTAFVVNSLFSSGSPSTLGEACRQEMKSTNL